MHISSLPSDYGIGTFGQAAYDFADYLEKSGQSLWQILPISPTGFGNSPYSSSSSFAGNPFFIDLDLLQEDGLLEKDEYQDLDWGEDPEQVDYGKVYNNRWPLLKKAAGRFLSRLEELEKTEKTAELEKYQAFKEDNQDWLNDYALYMAFKDANNGVSWTEWEEPYRTYSKENAKAWAEEFSQETEIYKAIQYLFDRQYEDLKKYVNAKGVKIIGDLPFYMALDCADVWARPDLYLLDEDHLPEEVAGCPPDNPYNPEDKGQVWGNPLYDWKAHKKEDYKWWRSRMEHAAKLYDIVRVDHFQGFDTCYAVPAADAKEKDARHGGYLLSPGMELFEAFHKSGKNTEIIVEDLGRQTPSLQKLLKDTGYPGMKVLEYAFFDREGERSANIPYNYPNNCVAYTGTHDNDTIQGWIESTNPYDLNFARDFMHSYGNEETLGWDMIRTLLASPASTTILQAQDLKALGTWARMNEPAAQRENWAWRIRKYALDDENANWVRHIVETYGRLPVPEEPEEEAETKAAAD